MIGAHCNAHIATVIGPSSRKVILCPRWVPGFARVCPECGSESPRMRIEAMLRGDMLRPWKPGDVEKTVRRAVGSWAQRKRAHA